MGGRESLPARGRGLKPYRRVEQVARDHVASRAGAWIETLTGTCLPRTPLVASRAGAWIETSGIR